MNVSILHGEKVHVWEGGERVAWKAKLRSNPDQPNGSALNSASIREFLQIIEPEGGRSRWAFYNGHSIVSPIGGGVELQAGSMSAGETGWGSSLGHSNDIKEGG